MTEIRRQVIGTDYIYSMKVKKERKTKNILTRHIVERKEKAIILDCGHKIGFTNFLSGAPTMNCRCRECERERDEGMDSNQSQNLQPDWLFLFVRS